MTYTAPMDTNEIRFYRVGDAYGCFSNFSAHPIEIDDERWLTTEHYFQAMKNDDPAHRSMIQATVSPMEAARLGRTTNLRPDWDAVKDDVMRTALRAKIDQHSDVREALLGTDTAKLIEHTVNDRYWADGGDGTGLNRLGHMLVELRDELTAAGAMNHVATLDRTLGALLGVHAGDSLGASVEFMRWEAVKIQYPTGLREIIGGGPFRWKAGAATDDTDLTRAVALAYAQHLADGTDLVIGAASQMGKWFTGDWPGRWDGSHPKDVGGATARGLTTYLTTNDPTSSGAGPGSAGNGSLMRCIATGLVRRDPTVSRSESMRISAITHDDVRCQVACAAYNEAVSVLVAGGSPDDAVSAALSAARDLVDGESVAAIELGMRLSLPRMAHTGEIPLSDMGGGFVLDSLSIAIAALLDNRSFEDVIVDVVRLGRDTDTNAAIAGGLVGARDGAAAIPKRWRDTLQFRDEFTELAGLFHRQRQDSAIDGISSTGP
jgi:ribA/ribD-fused uncharacterized protein